MASRLRLAAGPGPFSPQQFGMDQGHLQANAVCNILNHFHGSNVIDFSQVTKYCVDVLKRMCDPPRMADRAEEELRRSHPQLVRKQSSASRSRKMQKVKVTPEQPKVNGDQRLEPKEQSRGTKRPREDETATDPVRPSKMVKSVDDDWFSKFVACPDSPIPASSIATMPSLPAPTSAPPFAAPGSEFSTVARPQTSFSRPAIATDASNTDDTFLLLSPTYDEYVAYADANRAQSGFINNDPNNFVLPAPAHSPTVQSIDPRVFL